MARLAESGVSAMYSARGYEERAEECVRLANMTADPLVQAELLKLRQTFLQIAARLKTLNENAGLTGGGN
jgi:hypothetical protein